MAWHPRRPPTPAFVSSGCARLSKRHRCRTTNACATSSRRRCRRPWMRSRRWCAGPTSRARGCWTPTCASTCSWGQRSLRLSICAAGSRTRCLPRNWCSTPGASGGGTWTARSTEASPSTAPRCTCSAVSPRCTPTRTTARPRSWRPSPRMSTMRGGWRHRSAARAGEHPQHAAEFGRALLEWFALEPNLQ